MFSCNFAHWIGACTRVSPGCKDPNALEKTDGDDFELGLESAFENINK